MKSAPASTPPLDARVGTRLAGEFTLDAVLGQGGISTVYAATNRLGQRVCVKLMREELRDDPMVRARFLREVDIAASIAHRACVPIVRTASGEDGLPFHVMELVDGDPLDRVWRRLGRRVPIQGALRIAEQLLDLLEACHATGVVHCDIKPANLILDATGALRVIDFGDAYAPRIAPLDALAADAAVGTPSFMAPEQVTGEVELDGRVDVFAVGALLRTLLTGKLLHRGKSPDESLRMAATERVPPLRDDAPELSPLLLAVVDRALSYSRDDRYFSAREMRAAVTPLITRDERGSTRSARSADLRDDVESGERMRTTSARALPRVAAAGSLGVTPLPQLVRIVHQRHLHGSLLLTATGDRRRVRFYDGAPVCGVVGEREVLAELEELGALGDGATFEFLVEEPIAAEGEEPTLDPLAAVLAASRRFRGRHLAASLARLGQRPLRLHTHAALERFCLRADEERVVALLRKGAPNHTALHAAGLASRPVVDAVLYALGATHHLDLGSATRPHGI